MNGENIPVRELEAATAIGKVDKVSNHHATLLAAFDSDGVELAQFILFLVTNNLVSRSERYLLQAVLVKLAETFNLNSCLRLLWDVEREAKEAVLLFQDLFINKSYMKVK